MAQHYSDPSRETDPHALPDLETFYVGPNEWRGCPTCEGGAQQGFEYGSALMAEDHRQNHVGWYYWSCFPGCMPDSEPFGPFPSESLALRDARY